MIIGKTVRIRKPESTIIGDNVIIDDFTYIPCSIKIHDYTHIGANTTFIGGAGYVEIGSFVNIAPSCQIVTGTNDYRGGGLVGPTIPKDFAGAAIIDNIFIDNFALLGCQTILLPGVIIPQGMATGAFTLVKKHLYKPWTLYCGNPCHELGPRDCSIMIKQAKLLYESEGKQWNL